MIKNKTNKDENIVELKGLKIPIDTLTGYIIYPSNIDNRMVKCACGNEECKIGLNFDHDKKGNYMLLTDRFGNEHTMHLSKSVLDDLIKTLKGIKKSLKSKKKFQSILYDEEPFTKQKHSTKITKT